ncbi:MAG TPA: YebC/PmpR family DNA-binding transcriptional regulator [Deltaproteobacteria bacterium]|nr:YebC/PmpR family DNA-binding transcriptional regulator [Deltaproteobacteria bacterium]HPJ94527.1 YebC/PmpR family DNA-binding transcriptional regulator [Deltaproteobacteria bacterium]HPR52217.1 YebC/PmpR family DNA-binding transcriptional regulator [Deltaproteobacteria bacterium]
MSGHNKWSSIKHKKGAADAKRGKIFSRLIKEITVAARMGGGDIDGNARLRSAVAAAKASNMPKDNIERAIKKGTGELEGYNLEENAYEGYGPGGVAVLVNVLTDNKNRAVADIRHLFTKYNGNLGETGCVSWMFDKKGFASVDKGVVEEDTLYDIALEAGAEDISDEGDVFEIVIAPEDIEGLREALEDNNISYNQLEVQMIPQTNVTLTGKQAQQALKLLDALEDLDDVQSISSNFDIDDEEMAQLQAS